MAAAPRPQESWHRISVEAAEPMEHLQWLTHEQVTEAMRDEAKRVVVADEMADILIYSLSLANVLTVDVSAAVPSKLACNERWFPVEHWRGHARGVSRPDLSSKERV